MVSDFVRHLRNFTISLRLGSGIKCYLEGKDVSFQRSSQHMRNGRHHSKPSLSFFNKNSKRSFLSKSEFEQSLKYQELLETLCLERVDYTEFTVEKYFPWIIVSIQTELTVRIEVALFKWEAGKGLRKGKCHRFRMLHSHEFYNSRKFTVYYQYLLRKNVQNCWTVTWF